MTSRQKLAGIILPPEEELPRLTYELAGVRVDESGNSDLRITEDGSIRAIENPYHGEDSA